MSTPLVSIVLPTYRDAPFLARAIESVRAQSYTNWELIIIDDGLTESSVVARYVAEDIRIVCIHNPSNLGIQKSLNKGLDKARGTYIARIDDDDAWTDIEKLATQVAYMETHTSCVLVGTNARLVDSEGREIMSYRLPQTDQEIRKRMLYKNCFLHPSVLIRTSALAKSGAYDESPEIRHIEDYELWLRLALQGEVVNLPDQSSTITIHEDSVTSRNRIAQVRAMRKLIGAYRNVYPGYWMAYSILTIRFVGFITIATIPIPKGVLNWIQKIYKEL